MWRWVITLNNKLHKRRVTEMSIRTDTKIKELETRIEELEGAIQAVKESQVRIEQLGKSSRASKLKSEGKSK